MNQPIAVVGIACRYPDANSPAELWEVVLVGRRAFLRIADERLRLENYWSPDPAAPDKFHAQGRRQRDHFHAQGRRHRDHFHAQGRRHRDHQKNSGGYRDASSGSPADNPARSCGTKGGGPMLSRRASECMTRTSERFRGGGWHRHG